ncbi:TPA: hypothetical protein ACH9QY_003488 [Escherichia coli]|uniref:hypothetical protein n=1 Tax=Escherichia coli TaxID=562 RepID=UPI002076FEE8|nr:hypothetical protein [Escherichia coli]MCZ5798254.1 hypothetical protein [Escherichia coli]MCZ6062302.1 hypothetical protein [Escherichia coli]
MRNKGFNPPDTHKEVKRLRFLRSIDERTQISFVKVARTELLKAEARALLPSSTKRGGIYVHSKRISGKAAQRRHIRKSV